MKLFLAVLSVLIIGGVIISAPAHKSQAVPLNIVQSDKSDAGECTGQETVGHCIDKTILPLSEQPLPSDPTPVPESMRFGK